MGNILLAMLLGLLTTNEGQAMVFKTMPKTIRIGKKTYAIQYKDKVDGGKLLGVCYFDKKKIEISLEKGKKEAESTILHEMLHAIAGEYDFELSEKKVLQLEQSLFETLEQNGWTITKKK